MAKKKKKEKKPREKYVPPVVTVRASNEGTEMLDSPQREMFATFVASGKSQAEAYRLAYPKSKKWKPEALYTEASMMAATPEVALRVRWLRAIITQSAIESAELDKDFVVRGLKQVAARCMQAAPVLDKRGNPVRVFIKRGEEEVEVSGAFMFDAANANRALELLGKAEGGTFIEKKETGKPGEFSEKRSLEQLEKSVAERAARLGTNVLPLKRASG